MENHESYDALDAYWYVGLVGDVTVTGACGYLSGDVCGVYSVATPVEFRGRGYAATVTQRQPTTCSISTRREWCCRRAGLASACTNGSVSASTTTTSGTAAANLPGGKEGDR